MRFIFLFAIIIATTPLVAQEYDYFIVPPSWKELSRDHMPDSIQRCSRGKGRYITPPLITVAAEKTSLSAEAYCIRSKELMEHDNFTCITIMGTIETRSGQALLSIIDKTIPGGTVRCMQATLVSKGIAYTLTASALKKEFSDFYDAFFTAFASFTIP